MKNGNAVFYERIRLGSSWRITLRIRQLILSSLEWQIFIVGVKGRPGLVRPHRTSEGTLFVLPFDVFVK